MTSIPPALPAVGWDNTFPPAIRALMGQGAEELRGGTWSSCRNNIQAKNKTDAQLRGKDIGYLMQQHLQLASL